MDGALMRDDFNEFGQRFTAFYYDDEEDGYGNFMADYVTTMNTPALGSFYHVADNTRKPHQALKPCFRRPLKRGKTH